MKLKALAMAVDKSPPAVMMLQRKYGLPIYDDYSEGYAIVLRKIMYLAIFSVPVTDIKALLKHERALLELLKVDSVQDSSDWFEALCTMRTGPTRLLLSGYDVGHPVGGDAVQTGLDFKHRAKELFDAREMGADALKGLQLYAATFDRVRRKLVDESQIVRDATKWCRRAI